MENHIADLRKKFEQIKKMNWIENSLPHYRNAGLLFEALIGKKGDSYSVPDYYEIEIKTHRKNGQFPITLFNFSPISYSTNMPPCQYLVDNYGYKNKTNGEYKILYTNVFYNKITTVHSYYKFKLNINEKKERLELHIYNSNKHLMDNSTIIWPYEIIKDKLENKLKFLAYIEYQRKYENKTEYFKFIDIQFYDFTDFDTFIKLIKQQKIKISFNLGVYRSGEKKGKVYDHGTAFRIWSYDLPLLFTKSTKN